MLGSSSCLSSRPASSCRPQRGQMFVARSASSCRPQRGRMFVVRAASSCRPQRGRMFVVRAASSCRPQRGRMFVVRAASSCRPQRGRMFSGKDISSSSWAYFRYRASDTEPVKGHRKLKSKIHLRPIQRAERTNGAHHSSEVSGVRVLIVFRMSSVAETAPRIMPLCSRTYRSNAAL